MPPAANAEAFLSKDGVILIEALKLVKNPIVIPVNDICETTGEKPNTVAKRFNIIANRHGLKLSASTTTASRAPTRATTTTPGRGRAIKTNEDETVATPAQKSKPSTRKKKPATVKAEEALDNELAENNDEGAETATNLKLKSAVPKTVVGKKTNTEISKKPKTQPAVGDKDELEDGTANEHSESTTCDTPTPAPKQASTAITTPNADSTAVSPSTPQTKSPSKYNVKPPPRPPSRSLSKTPGPVTTPTQTKKRKLTPTSGTDIGKKQIKQELAEFQETRIAELNTKMTKDANLEALMSMEDNTMAGEQSGYGADEYLDDMKIESPEDIEPEELLAAFD